MLLRKKPVLIGIAGGSASGKTTIARLIADHFSEANRVIIIKEDDYYKEQFNMTYEERSKINYDHPFAFDTELLHRHLQMLIDGEEIKKPIYDYTIHNRSKETEVVHPADVIILEGLFVLENKETRSLLDIKIFCDSPADVRFIRRLLRDVKERGRQLDNIVEQYLNTVRVMHEEFVEPSKRYADLIVPNVGSNSVAYDLLITKINSIISQNSL